MASENVLRQRIRWALEAIAAGPCACGAVGQRSIVLRWDEGSRNVDVSIECRACESLGLARVVLAEETGEKGGVA